MPLKQGDMDGLCGAYSIVNAMRVIRLDKKEESKDIFKEIIAHLSRNRNLRIIITSGMTIGILYHIINDLIPRSDFPRSRPFQGVAVTLPQLWNKIRKFLENPVNGTGAVIVGLSGTHEHWTVIKRIDDENIYLEDSGGIRSLPREEITIKETNVNRLRCHQIIPDEVIFINNPAAKQRP